MKLTCSKSELYKALSVVSRAVPSKPVLPALGGILMKAADDGLSLTGYDLNIGITTRIDAKVAEAGELDLPAKTFTDIAKCLPEQEVSLQSDDALLTTVKSGLAEYTIAGISASDYPEMPAGGDWERLTLPASTLKSMIGQTLFAIATSDSKPIHTGALFEAAPEQLTVVSLDGFRLALRKEDTAGNLEARFVIPGKTLSELCKLLKGEEEVALLFNHRNALIHVGPYQINTRLLEGAFLEYKAVIPPGSATTAVVSTKALLDSVARTSLLISDRLKSPLRLQFSGDRIHLSCRTALGQAVDEIPCIISGKDLEIGFNSRYLLDALQAVEEEEVKLELGNSVSPMKVVSPNNEKYLFMVLPVRIHFDATA